MEEADGWSSNFGLSRTPREKKSGCAHCTHARITRSESKFPLSTALCSTDPDLRTHTEHAAPTQHLAYPFSGTRLSKTQPRHTRHARDLKKKKSILVSYFSLKKDFFFYSAWHGWKCSTTANDVIKPTQTSTTQLRPHQRQRTASHSGLQSKRRVLPLSGTCLLNRRARSSQVQPGPVRSDVRPGRVDAIPTLKPPWPDGTASGMRRPPASRTPR